MGTLKNALKSVPGLVHLVRRLRGRPAYTPRERILNALPRGAVGAEIGVYEGDFAARLLREASPKRMHLIDPWKCFPEYEEYTGVQMTQEDMTRRFDQVKERFRTAIKRGRVRVHRAESAEAAEGFEDEYFDWVYIDGNHFYEYVRQDLELYYPKVKRGGLLAGDDYGNEGWWGNGVQEAVDEFVAGRDLSCQVYGSQFIIRKPEDVRRPEDPPGGSAA